MNDHKASGVDSAHLPDVGRRKLNVAVLAALAGGFALADNAQAFPRGARLHFAAASRLLAPYGISVDGDAVAGHDRVSFDIAQLPTVEYVQAIGIRNRSGEVEPSFETSAFGDDAIATHFHPGEIIPCVRTTIQGHELATHEVFDTDQGGIIPCVRVESEMLDGGHIGTVVLTHFHDGAIVPCVRTTIEDHSLATHELFDASDGDIVPCVKVESGMLKGGVLGDVDVTVDADLTGFRVHVGDNVYELIDGALVLQRSG